MLVEGQLVAVKIGTHTFKHYKELGYDVHRGATIYVPPEHLTPQSNAVVQVRCDVCQKIIPKTYQNYVNQHTHDMDVCFECKEAKTQITNLEKYDAPYAFCNEDVKKKIQETNLSKHGASHPMQSDVIKQKTRQTLLDKYGVESVLQYPLFMDKVKQTNLQKFGCEYFLQNKDIREAMKQTSREKYGTEFPQQSEQVKAKIRQANLEKYGFACCLQNKTIKDKVKNTMLERYGVENFFMLPNIQEQIRRTMYENGTVPTSKPQLALFEMVKNKYSDAELNYPLGSLSLDVFVIVNGVSIDIEYDGWYYHKDKKRKDFRRDMYARNHGIKILRIRSSTILPTEEELFSAIDYLVNTEHHFKEIILSDWPEQTEEVVTNGIKNDR